MYYSCDKCGNDVEENSTTCKYCNPPKKKIYVDVDPVTFDSKAYLDDPKTKEFIAKAESNNEEVIFVKN